MNLGKLKFLRDEMGWSIRELERHSGVSRTLIGDIENGVANPTIKTLEQLAEAFGVSISIFFEED